VLQIARREQLMYVALSSTNRPRRIRDGHITCTDFPA